MEIILQPARVVEKSPGGLIFAAPREWLAHAGISTGDVLYSDFNLKTGEIEYRQTRGEWSRKTTVTLQNRTPYIGISVYHARAAGIGKGDSLEFSIKPESRNLFVKKSLTLEG